MKQATEPARSRFLQIRRIQPETALDAGFYTSFYVDLKGFSKRGAQQHWTQHGEAEGRFPNPAAALRRLLGDDRLPDGFDLEGHRAEASRARAIRWDFEVVQYVLEKREQEQQAADSHVEATDQAVDDEGTVPQERLRELPDTFNIATYLARNADVRAVVPHPAAGILHYLDNGKREDRSFLPERVNIALVEHIYRVNIPGSLNKEQVAAFVRKQQQLPATALVFLSELELFWYHGIKNPDVLGGFDPEYYWLRAHPDGTSKINRFDAMVHFCEVGQFEAADVSGALIFDENFYAFEYGAAGGLSFGHMPQLGEAERRELFRDWLASAEPTLRSPNLRLWAAANLDFLLSASVERQIGKAGAKPSDPAVTSRSTELFRPFVEGDLDVILAIDVLDEGGAEFLSSVADRLSVVGKAREADATYAHVLANRPDHGGSLRHRADQAQRAELYGIATTLREQIIASRRADVWTHLTRADCFSAMSMDDRAADALAEGVKAFPGDVALRRRAEQSAAEAFGNVWSHSTANALRHRIAPTQQKIREALARCTSRAEPTRRRQSIRRVAIYANQDLPQCRFYRVEQKVEQLSAAGFDVLTFDYVNDTASYLARLPEIDLTIAYRVPAFPHVIDALQKTAAFGIPTVYEIDDLVFDPSQFPPELESYDGQISEEHHASMACGVPLFAHAMSLCDYAMASTEALRPPMAATVRTGVAYLHANAMSDLHDRYAAAGRVRHAPDRVTIFYGSATKAHKADFRDLIEPALAAVLERHGSNVRVLLVGWINLSPLLDPYRDMIDIFEPMSRVEDYWDLLREADINLSVLSRSTFNDCKSEIKWLEAAMMGIPSVVSRSTTYEHVIDDGRSGFLCDDADAFTTALLRLVADAALREEVGRTARQDALERYSKPAMAENLRRVVADIERRMPPPRPRVLVVNVFYPPQAIGGATRVVHDNIRDLKQHYDDRIDVSVLCTLEGGTRAYETEWYGLDGVRVARISTPDRPDVDKVMEDPQMGAAFARCLDLIRPDLVHFHCIQRLTTSVIDVVRRRGTPFIVTMHDGWWISPNQFILGQSGEMAYYDFKAPSGEVGSLARMPERARVLRRLLQSAACVTAVSPQFAQICRDVGVADVIAVENGLSDVPAIVRSPGKGRVRLGHLGGTELHKGLPLLRAVLHTTPFKNLSLTVVDLALSVGASRSEMWGTTPVTIRAKAARDEMADVYGAIDVLVAPSIWPESFGLVTREAVAAGCWIVASDRGAIGACVTEGQNGFVVQVDTPSGLRDALAAIDAEPERFQKTPAYIVPVRPASEQAAELVALYERLLERTPREASSPPLA